MREAIHRFNSLLFAWIPDVSGVPARRQVTIGIAASVLLHALLVLIVVIFSGMLPQRVMDFAKSKPQLQEIELIVIPPEPEVEQPKLMELAANPERQFLDSRGLNASADGPENALLESDIQMRAASELPATGSVPLPSQAGLDRPAPNFTTQKDTLGAKPEPAAPPAPAVEPKPMPQTEVVPPPPEPVVEQPPAPVKETPAISELAALAQETMRKFRDVTKSGDDQIAMTKPMVTPPDTVTRIAPVAAQPVPQPRPVEMAKLTTPPPRAVPVPKSGYQPYQEKTKIEGSITNKGRNAVDAISTPLARYKKQVNDAIGSRWYYYVNQRMDLISAGSVRISFAIDARGKPSGVSIDSNTANQSFADVCMRAVREAEIQPPPSDVIAPIKDGRLEYSLTFTFYNL